ncbi:MAG: hypothetical protein MJE66_13735 [Proteobacteria bacterium]|nr:hypothetical protein [Pseudomonadota bacterium]
MPTPLPYRQRSLEPWRKRAARVWRRLVSGHAAKDQRVYLVEAGGRRLKRTILEDSARAAQAERNLERFRDTELVPRVVARYGNELYTEFVEGRPAKPADPGLVDGVALALSTLYACEPRALAPAEAGLERAVAANLDLLERAGILSRDTARRLGVLARELAPDRVWLGFDYTDPLCRNFLWDRNGRLRLIDVESLVADRPLGMGVAKALARGLEPQRDALLAALAARPGPDLAPSLPFVELWFLTRWQKRALLHNKADVLDPAYFDRYLERCRAEAG